MIVLLTDDNDAILDTLTAALRRGQHQVLVARTGEEALEVFGEHAAEIDVVVLDVRLPAKSGIDVYHEIRRWLRGVPVVLISGYAQESAHAEALSLVDDRARFLAKPFDPDVLGSMLAEVTA
uniref:Putative response regulator receiver domain contining protein n=1 Tax=viral metagenome TaxID=1070528 RepID=A0A6M3M0J5_9ZZZZ